LNSLTSVPEGFNPTIGQSLHLSSITAVPEWFSPTVGGYLRLHSHTAIPKGFKPSDYEGKQIPIISWENGKYVSIDGVFSEVLQKAKNVYKLRQINGTILYCVTDGKGKYAHGKTIKEACNDLIYKLSSEGQYGSEALKRFVCG
jgi:hypothetical protein